jgi:peptidoglycan/xylan/chitin deacetylase (PgdA/CDA1 family)
MMNSELSSKNKYAVRVFFAALLTFLLIATVIFSVIISNRADPRNEEFAETPSVAAPDSMRLAPAATSGGMRDFPGTIGSSAGADYIPQPKDLLSFRFDARRLIFGKVGDTLNLELITPSDVDVTEIQPTYTTSDASVATVSEDGTVTATGFGKCAISAVVGNLKTSADVAVAKKWAAITFDDGPGKDTPRLLKALEKRGINATFFIVGRNGVDKSGQSSLQTMAAGGNEIANHTYAHSYKTSELKSGLEKADKVIMKATGKPAALMRPPGGIIDKYTKKCGKPIIMWSVDPQDWKHRDADYVKKHVTKNIKSGSIVLLHDIHTTSVDAALRIYDALEKKGYTFVTVSELLENPEANTVYSRGPSDVPTKKILY